MLIIVTGAVFLLAEKSFGVIIKIVIVHFHQPSRVYEMQCV